MKISFHLKEEEKEAEKFDFAFSSIHLQVFQGVCVRWTLMSVPAPPARMELNAQMVPTSTPANVPKVNFHTAFFQFLYFLSK